MVPPSETLQAMLSPSCAMKHSAQAILSSDNRADPVRPQLLVAECARPRAQKGSHASLRPYSPALATFRKLLRPRTPHLTRILMLASERESQRDSAIKPRVASCELPWETSGIAPPQPRGGCADCSYD